jgi:hypothetical protein
MSDISTCKTHHSVLAGKAYELKMTLPHSLPLSITMAYFTCFVLLWWWCFYGPYYHARNPENNCNSTAPGLSKDQALHRHQNELVMEMALEQVFKPTLFTLTLL